MKTDRWRLFLRFLLWFIDDFESFRSLEDKSSESGLKQGESVKDDNIHESIFKWSELNAGDNDTTRLF